MDEDRGFGSAGAPPPPPRRPGRPPAVSRLPRRPPRRPGPRRPAGAPSPARRRARRAGSPRPRFRRLGRRLAQRAGRLGPAAGGQQRLPPGVPHRRRHPRRARDRRRDRARRSSASQLVEQVQENPDAVFGGECLLVSAAEVSDALGQDVEVLALEGIADGTMGAILDKRLLAGCDRLLDPGRRHDRPDRGGRQRRGDGVPEQPRGGRGQLPLRRHRGIGDEAFCTTIDQQGSGGVLVRFGERVVYVSIVAESSTTRPCARRRRRWRGRSSRSADRRWRQWLGPGAPPPDERSYSSSSIPMVTSP